MHMYTGSLVSFGKKQTKGAFPHEETCVYVDTLPFEDDKFSTENPWEKKGISWELTVKKR